MFDCALYEKDSENKNPFFQLLDMFRDTTRHSTGNVIQKYRVLLASPPRFEIFYPRFLSFLFRVEVLLSSSGTVSY